PPRVACLPYTTLFRSIPVVGGSPDTQVPWPFVGVLGGDGSESQAHGGKAGATRKKHRLKRWRKSELLVVPAKPGNRPTGPGGGKGWPQVETVGGQHAGYTGTR